MPMIIRKALIVHFSPGGSTAHVARVMEKKIESLKTPVTTIDLIREPDVPFILPQLLDAKDNICLYVGSPVYALHPVPAVMDFISILPAAERGYAVPFVTWGGVSSGVALPLMGEALQERGYTVLGAAKVLAKHSLMWASDAPVGENHPDANDDGLIEALVDGVEAKVKEETPRGLALPLLRYQEERIWAHSEKMNLDLVRATLPAKVIHEERCTQCGLCVQECPAQAITLSPYPEFGPSCLCCLNCVRLCPEQAIVADLSDAMGRIKIIAEWFHERPFTQIFI